MSYEVPMISAMFVINAYKGVRFLNKDFKRVVFKNEKFESFENLYPIFERDAVSDLINKAKIFTTQSFGETVFRNPKYIEGYDKEKSEVGKAFIEVIHDFIESFDEKKIYTSYVYATFIICIMKEISDFLEDNIFNYEIFQFIHFCRKNFIINI